MIVFFPSLLNSWHVQTFLDKLVTEFAYILWKSYDWDENIKKRLMVKTKENSEHVAWGLILEGAMGARNRVGTKLECRIESPISHETSILEAGIDFSSSTFYV